MALAGTYSRSQFGGWKDLDKDCQNTRQEILIRDAVYYVLDDTGCKVISGSWVDPFSGKHITDPSTMDIDHLIPLHHAWDKGADEWTKAERVAFANDYNNLLAVIASENRSKQSRTPANWMPANFQYWCKYVEKWVFLKGKYDLPMGDMEDTTTTMVGKSCARR